MTGIDLNIDGQKKLIAPLIEFGEKIPFTLEQNGKYRYHFDNNMYAYADGTVLFTILNVLQPKKLIEVGSGFSSALILDTKDKFLNNPLELTFIDPNPQDRLHALLKDEDYKTTTIISNIVQNTAPENFTVLQENDILLIDNSHVSKTGSDVNYLMTEILPVLNKGVFVHIHDIFFPFEYPEDWIFQHRRNWNELYSVHNFLLFNNAFKIVFFSDYIQQTFKQDLVNDSPLFFKDRPGSIWLQKVV